MEPTSGTGFTLSPPNFYDGLTFSGHPGFVDCAESQELVFNCTDLLVCAATDTPMMDAVRSSFPDQYIVPVANSGLLVNGLVEGSCNVIGSNPITSETVRSQGFTGDYKIGLNRFSKEPRALVTRQDDARWSDFVAWIVQATLAAEEQGITKATGNLMPETLLFGPVYSEMLRNAILAVGNIGEIYERNIGARIPRAALNLLNDGGPQIYPLPAFK
jgi:general L-amino acid transport system substrate-binding protein